jgi:hypothetical protein
MTVYEYREQHPKCDYCRHLWPGLGKCQARKIYPKKGTAKKCPLYEPEEYERENRDPLRVLFK